MRIISFVEANKDFKAIFDAACDSDNVITIKRSKTDNTVIMSLSQVDGAVPR